MGQIQSFRSQCSVDFDVDACAPTISPGAFETNADIAGWGVLVAFIAGAGITVSLCIILSLIHFKRHFYPSDSSSGATRSNRAGVEGNKTLRFTDKVTQDIVLNLSDQQIVTGLALCIYTLFSKGACDISAYHYNIVANLVLITICTHVCSIMVLPDYFRNPWLGGLRIFGIAVIVAFSGLLFSNQKTVSALPIAFPTAVPPIPKENTTTSNLADIGLLIPAICYQVEDSKLADNLKALVDNPDFRNLDDALVGLITKGRALNGYTQWISLAFLYCVGVILALLQRLLEVDTGDETWRRWWRKLAWLPRCLVIIFGCWAGVTSFIYIRSMRDWLSKSGWWEPEDPKADEKKNPEDDILGFGQLVPILMLTLVVVAFLESAYGRWQERKTEDRGVTTQPQTKNNGSSQV